MCSNALGTPSLTRIIPIFRLNPNYFRSWLHFPQKTHTHNKNSLQKMLSLTIVWICTKRSTRYPRFLSKSLWTESNTYISHLSIHIFKITKRNSIFVYTKYVTVSPQTCCNRCVNCIILEHGCSYEVESWQSISWNRFCAV